MGHNKHTHTLFTDPTAVGLIMAAIGASVGADGEPNAEKATKAFVESANKRGVFGPAHGPMAKAPSAALAAATTTHIAAIIKLIAAIGELAETSVAVNAELQAHG